MAWRYTLFMKHVYILNIFGIYIVIYLYSMHAMYAKTTTNFMFVCVCVCFFYNCRNFVLNRICVCLASIAYIILCCCSCCSKNYLIAARCVSAPLSLSLLLFLGAKLEMCRQCICICICICACKCICIFSCFYAFLGCGLLLYLILIYFAKKTPRRK